MKKIVVLPLAALAILAGCTFNESKDLTKSSEMSVDLKKEYGFAEISSIMQKMEKEMIVQGLKNVALKQGEERLLTFNAMVYGLRTHLGYGFRVEEATSSKSFFLGPQGNELSIVMISQSDNGRKVRLKSTWSNNTFSRSFGVWDCNVMDCQTATDYLEASEFEKLLLSKQEVASAKY